MFSAGPVHGERVGEYRGEPVYHASLSLDEYRALLSNIGFDVVAHAVEDWQIGGGRTVWLTRAHSTRLAEAPRIPPLSRDLACDRIVWFPPRDRARLSTLPDL
jgi:hypothetical protein